MNQWLWSGISTSGPRHPDHTSGQPGAQRRGSELKTLSPTSLGVEDGGANRNWARDNLDGARREGNRGGSAGGRHPDRASGQPGGACAPLGEQVPPPAAPICHGSGRGRIFGIFGIFRLRRQPSMNQWRGRPESRHQDPGGQRREERGRQAPGPGLRAAWGSMRASGRSSASSRSYILSRIRGGGVWGEILQIASYAGPGLGSEVDCVIGHDNIDYQAALT